MNLDWKNKSVIEDNIGTAGKMGIRATKERIVQDKVKPPHLVSARGHINGCPHRPTKSKRSYLQLTNKSAKEMSMLVFY